MFHRDQPRPAHDGPERRTLRFGAIAAGGLAAIGLAAPAQAQGIGLLSGLRAEPSPAMSSAGAYGAVASDARSALALRRGWREAEGRHMAALDIRLAEGWKTYWRVPGDAGIPPYFDWSGSENLAAVEVSWPAPIAFDTYGMTTLGYEHRVTLPLQVTAQDPARPVSLRLVFAYGLCAEICIPAEAALELTLPSVADASDASGAAAPAIVAALAAQPTGMVDAGVEVRRCGLVGSDEARALEAVFVMPAAPGEAPMAVVEGPETYWFHAAEVSLDGREVAVTAPLDPASPGGWLARDALRVTLLGGAGAVETDACAG